MQETDLPPLELKTDTGTGSANDWFDRAGFSGILLIAGLVGLGLVYNNYLQQYNGATLTERNSHLIIGPEERQTDKGSNIFYFRIEGVRAHLAVTGSAYDLVHENKEAKQQLLALRPGDRISVKTLSTDDHLTTFPSEKIQVIGIQTGHDVILDPQKLKAVNNESRNKYLWIAGLLTAVGSGIIIFKFLRKMASKHMWEKNEEQAA